MRSAAGRIVLKIVILFGCIACVITKALTDQLSRRVFLRNQKLSREWGLLHNLYWSSSGNAFANVTYGGFTLITVLMLISRFIDAKSRPSLVEKIFLTVGMLCFFAMGGVVFSAFDQVPADLHVNAIVLGCLSFAVALLMLVDLADPMARHTSDTTQTDFPTDTATMTPETTAYDQHKTPTTAHQQLPIIPQRPHPKRPAVVPMPTPPSSAAATPELVDPSSGQYTRADTVDYVHARRLPIAQRPAVERLAVHHPPQPPHQQLQPQHHNAIHPAVFEKLLLPEKQRPSRHTVADPHANHSQLQYSNLALMQQHPQQPQSHPQRPPPRPVPPPVPYRSQVGPPQSPPSLQQFGHRRGDAASQSFGQLPRHADRRRSGSSSNGGRVASSARGGQPPHCSRRNSSSGEDEQRGRPSAIQPGFVAHAARFWDRRAQQNTGELNTIV